jgi:tetratricopeptide (TPR) repeat protein
LKDPGFVHGSPARGALLRRKASAALLAALLVWGCKAPYSGELLAGDRLVSADPAGAARHYQQAVALGAVVQGNVGLARVDEARRDWQKAIDHYRLAKNGAPNDANVRLGLVRAYVSSGDRKQALSELSGITEQNPRELRAALLLGALASTRAEAQAALAALDRAAAAPSNASGAPGKSLEQAVVRREVLRLLGKPQEADAPIRPQESRLLGGDAVAISLASHYARTGRPNAALRLLHGATEQSPARSAAWVPLLRQELAVHNYKTARDALRQMPSKLRETPEVLELEARLLLATGDANGASTAARRAVERTGTAASDKPARIERLVLLGQTLSRAKRDDEAVDAFEQALGLDPKIYVARLALVAIDLRHQRFDQAAQAARLVIQEQPKLPNAHELLIAVLMAQGNQDEARAAANAYVAALPRSAEAVAMRAKVLLELGEPRSARADLVHALELQPSLMPAFELILDLERKLGGYDAAAALGARLAQKAGTSAAYVRLGAFHDKNGQHDAAAKCFRRAVELSPSDVGAWRVLATHLAAHAQRDEAIAALQKVVALAPRREDGYRELAKLQSQAGRVDRARSTYQQWLAINPRAVAALNNLAMLYAESRAAADLDQGILLAERAHAEAPSSAAVSDTLGWLLVRRGGQADLPRAVALLESANGTEEIPEHYYHLGAAQAAAGNRDGAVAALRKATRPEAKYPGREEAQRLLTELSR